MMARPVRSGVPFRSSLVLLWSLFLFGVLLSGCAPIERQQARVRAWWAQISGTASGVTATVRGTANATVEAGRQVIDTASGAARRAGETLEEFQDRVRKVQEGAKKIQEGKKMIEEGVGS
ncbi:MAG: hypothetical protein Q7S29_02355 [Candidatus Peribacter sp.]|nr:hypothetical protein [Candidatus Peribacter sp.]